MIHTHILFPYNRRYTITFIGQTGRPCSLKFTHARPKQTMLFIPGAGMVIQSENTSGRRRQNWDLNAKIQMLILCDFRLLREVATNCALLDYYLVSCGHFLPTFRDNLSAPSPGFKAWILEPADGTDSLSRNVGKK